MKINDNQTKTYLGLLTGRAVFWLCPRLSRTEGKFNDPLLLLEFWWNMTGKIIAMDKKVINMKFQKIKISPQTTLYYDQKPDQRLVQLVNTHFDFEMDHLPQEADRKMMKKSHDMPREIYTLAFNDKVYYIKKFYKLSFKQKLKYFSLKPRALRNFLLSFRLNKAGFDTPEPQFVLIHRKGFFKSNESILVTKESQGASFQELIGSIIDIPVKEKILLNLAQTLNRFYKKGFVQTDPSLRNFLIEFSDNDYRMIFIDIDAVVDKPLFITRAVLKRSLSRFWACLYYNLENELSNLLQIEKIVFLVWIISRAYNFCIKIKPVISYLIPKRVE